MLGTQELLLIGIAVLLLFGANKIPELARSLGRASGEFRKAKEETERQLADVEKAIKDDETKIKQIAKELGIDSEGKSDSELLEEISKKIKR